MMNKNKLSPRVKQFALYGGVLVVVAIVIALIPGGKTAEERALERAQRSQDDTVSVFTATDPDEVSARALADRLTSTDRKNDDLERDLRRLEEELARLTRGNSAAEIREVAGLRAENADIRAEMTALADQLASTERQLLAVRQGGSSATWDHQRSPQPPISVADPGTEQDDPLPTDPNVLAASMRPIPDPRGEDSGNPFATTQERAEDESSAPAPAQIDELTPFNVFGTPSPLGETGSNTDRATVQTENPTPQPRSELPSNLVTPRQPTTLEPAQGAGPSNGGSLVWYSETQEGQAREAELAEVDAEPDEQQVDALPAGSIIKGVFLSGMDVPTGESARESPFPALVRVKAEAILPNRFQADFADCHILVSGFGDLSSERAYLRGETLSCMRNDGAILELALPGYTNGLDGKAGIRGRLVSKQGQLISRAAMAGFAEGVASMFSASPVPTIQTSNSSTTPFQTVLSADAVQGAAVQGVSSAPSRIAEFYMNLADQVFPVLEIDAGRRVTFITTQAVQLRFKEPADVGRQAAPDLAQNQAQVAGNAVTQILGHRNPAANAALTAAGQYLTNQQTTPTSMTGALQ